MLKRDVFIAAMKEGNYTKLAWIISAFAITRDTAPTAVNVAPYKYQLKSDALGYYYCSPVKENTFDKIEDSATGDALYRFKEKVLLTPEDIPNLKEPIESTYGNLLFNWICIVYAFGSKMPYIQGRVNGENINKTILNNLLSTPDDGVDRDPNTYYIDEYLKYTEGMSFLTGLTQLCVQGATEKTMLPPPGIKEYRDKLIEENKESLGNLTTVAKIDKALVEYDAAYLKGDPGEDFLMQGKSRDIIRKKLFLSLGSEMSLDSNTVKSDFIATSLYEGWDIKKFATMNNTSRAGSFSRGAQTQEGGVSVKWLQRASSNMNITIDDCESRLGGVTYVEESNKHKLVGFSIITQEGSKRIVSEDDASRYLGKKIMMRNPMYCRLDKTDYCKVCVGERLSVNTEGLSIAISSYGSAFLAISMSAVHGKQLALAKMDYKVQLF